MEWDNDAECWREYITIENIDGIHARPSALIAQIAAKFEADILIIKDTQTANAKEILDIMLLAMFHKSEIILETFGDDAKEACMQISACLCKEFNFEK